VPRDIRVALFRLVLLQRLIEERVIALYRQGRIPGSVYTGRGQEGVSAATGLATIALGIVLDLKRRREELWRIRVLRGRARDAEVADLRLVVLVEKDVRRLQVRVDDAARVREREPVRDLVGEPHGVGQRERAGALDALLQRRAGDVLHDDERQSIDLTDVVDADDVRMGELRERPRLFDEELSERAVGRRLGVEHLHRDLAAEGGVLREIDLRRSAGAYRLKDPVSLIEDAIQPQLRTPSRCLDAYDSPGLTVEDVEYRVPHCVPPWLPCRSM